MIDRNHLSLRTGVDSMNWQSIVFTEREDESREKKSGDGVGVVFVNPRLWRKKKKGIRKGRIVTRPLRTSAT